jgi:hypothetical protein
MAHDDAMCDDRRPIADNHATHKHPNVQQWLARHPRLHIQVILIGIPPV